MVVVAEGAGDELMTREHEKQVARAKKRAERAKAKAAAAAAAAAHPESSPSASLAARAAALAAEKIDRDASGNKKLQDVGKFLTEQISTFSGKKKANEEEGEDG